MAFQICPGIATVTLQISGPGADIMENVLHFYKGSNVAWTATELTTLVNGIDTWTGVGDGAGNKYTNSMSTGASIISITARDMTTATGPEIVKTVAHPGTDASALLQSGVSKAFTFRSGNAGRSQRGRAYMSNLCSGSVSGTDVNSMAAASLTGITAMWKSLIAATTALNAAWYWCVLSRKQNGIVLVNGLPVKITDVGTSKTQFDYQRRRAPLHGRHH